jgi:hypothetical protein
VKRTTVGPYQFALHTSRSPEQVLGELDVRRLPGIGVAERGTHYLVLRPDRRFRYGADLAVGLGIAVVLAVLVATAATPLFIVLLPAALLPAIPLLLERRPDLAVSAIDDEGVTMVTVHGQASPELAAALDAFLGALPQPNGHGPQPVVSGGEAMVHWGDPEV